MSHGSGKPRPDPQGLAQGPTCPAPSSGYDRVLLGHGGGGLLSQELVRDVFVPPLDNPALSELHDGALLDVGGQRLAMSTDAFVVSPLFFPGGDIGSLAVHGTVNDLAMCGAQPLALSAAFVLEEGLPMETLRRVVASMGEAARRVGVPIVTGDTKVVQRGKGDGIFIATTGLGAVAADADVRPRRARPGDAVLVSGPIGRHGVVILSARERLGLQLDLQSDSAPLHGLVGALLGALGRDVHVLRDATRGGVASALNEIAGAAAVGIALREADVPVPDAVRGACELLGLDPLHVANEGCCVAIVAPEAVDAALVAMRGLEVGAGAALIGRVVAAHPGEVVAQGPFGGGRVVDMMRGEQLPRIC